MGNCSADASDEQIREQLRGLDLAKYQKMNPQLREKDIVEIYRMFLLRGPKDGRAKCKALFKNYREDPAVRAQNYLSPHATIDFDSWFDIMGQMIVEKRRKYGQDTEFIVEENPPQPLFNCGPSGG